MSHPLPFSPVVLVTGAGRRIGAAITRTLHAQGCTVILHAHRSRRAAEDLADALCRARAGSASVIVGDLLAAEFPSQCMQYVRDVHGRLDGLVNNASSFFPTPLGGIDQAAWDDLVGTNFKAPLYLTQALAPLLRMSTMQGGGALVNITDVHAERPLPGYPLYSAAKGALLTLTRALAIELAPQVRVNAVAPGPILWPEDGQFSSAEQAQIVDHTLLKRAGTAEDIARVVNFLLAEAHYMTGQVLNVDGGRTAHL